jgi:hypothetical protein
MFYVADSIADVFWNIARFLANILYESIRGLLKVLSVTSGSKHLLSPGLHRFQCSNDCILKFDAFFANGLRRIRERAELSSSSVNSALI